MKIAKMPNGGPEIYDAVQGEGATMGKPMAFVRTTMCNLSCNFCDTYYTWYWKGTPNAKKPHDFAKPVDPKEYMLDMTTQEVADTMRRVCKNHKAAVFTGGEPLLQQKDIIQVMDMLHLEDDDWYFEIETNATVMPTDELLCHLNQLNTSPKLLSSGNDPKMSNKPEVIAKFLEERERFGYGLCFKFVVRMNTWEQDMAEIKTWEKTNKVPRKFIYLMPQGIRRAEIQKGTAFLNEIAQKQNYKVSTRLQILIYGDKRAV